MENSCSKSRKFLKPMFINFGKCDIMPGLYIMDLPLQNAERHFKEEERG